ncbi:29698_t:CDS:2 [Gigaspora margarita]|uniref:29698_t:CDS:1 n=1 Tax=Gigaspora margarita TaxID=4874 RepID=A0ABN7WSG4_GIGMA|nr:29698_t:CDS:2 [Gigaspora margarita]
MEINLLLQLTLQAYASYLLPINISMNTGISSTLRILKYYSDSNVIRDQ